MPEATVPIVGPNVVRFPNDVGSDTRATSVTPWATDTDDAPAGFELLEVVGTGGMGVVRRARDLSLDCSGRGVRSTPWRCSRRSARRSGTRTPAASSTAT